MQASGARLIDLDMIPDENHPSMNKLIIHPVVMQDLEPPHSKKSESRVETRNPDINRENNDIFNAFNELL